MFDQSVVTYAVVVLVSVAGALVRTGRLVSRRAIEEVAADRDQWRLATQRADEDLRTWQEFHTALDTVIQQQQVVLDAALGEQAPEPAPKRVTQQVDRLRSVQQRNHFTLASEQQFAFAIKQWRGYTQDEAPSAVVGGPVLCTHPETVDVEISTGEVVAQICTTCQTQIVMEAWQERDLVEPTELFRRIP